MTTYNTGNPIGSKDPRDLYDNAENLDVFVNDKTKESHPDRLGVPRKTWHGMEQEFDTDQAVRENEFDSAQAYRESRFNNFIAASGYQFLGDYAAGIEITEYNQIVRDADGEFWRLSGEVELPYTTTGDWESEASMFVAVGDAALRQELANPDMGAAMVARSVVAVDSIADLLALPDEQKREDLRYLVKGYHAGTGVGGGEFYWDAASTEDENGGTVFGDAAQGRWLRGDVGHLTPEMFGAIGDGIAGDYNALYNFFDNTGRLVLSSGKTYLIETFPDRFRLRSNTHISGSGSLVSEIPNIGNLLHLENVENISIQGISILLNDFRDYSVSVGSGSPFFIQGACKNIVIENCEIRESSRDAVYARETIDGVPTDIWVVNNRFSDITRTAVSFVGGVNITVSGNNIGNCGLSGINAEAHAPATILTGVTISNNTVLLETNRAGVISIQNPQGFSTDNFRDILVQGNTVSTGSSVAAISLHSSLPGLPGGYSICKDNVVYNATSGIGGRFRVIQGNSILNGVHRESSSTRYAISVSSGALVRDNIIENWPNNGIYVGPSVRDAIVMGNYISNWGQVGGSVFEINGVYVRGDRCTFRDNILNQDSNISVSAIYFRDGEGHVSINNQLKGTLTRENIRSVSWPQTSHRSDYYRKYAQMQSPPNQGAWSVGDIAENISPSAGSYMGWVCVSAGDFDDEEADNPQFKGFGYIEP